MTSPAAFNELWFMQHGYMWARANGKQEIIGARGAGGEYLVKLHNTTLLNDRRRAWALAWAMEQAV